MRILMIGDVVGRPGREAINAIVPKLRDELRLDLVIANGENAAGGFGITSDIADELFCSGIDVITSGNHIWDQREIIEHLDSEIPLLRPLNYPPDTPGRGYVHIKDVLVINLIGRLFVGTFDCPFRTVDKLLRNFSDRPKVIVVDLHAEATSEKESMGWYLDGIVSVVAGTHTHVPTADTRILPNGTAYVSDLGMVGPLNSVIGSEVEDALARFVSQMPQRLRIPSKGPLRFNSVLIDVDEMSGEAIDIVRIDKELSNDVRS